MPSKYASITPNELKGRLETGDDLVLLDVREPWEYETTHIEGSRLVPMGELQARSTELDPAKETVVICHHGTRSAFVTQLLDRAGFEKVLNLEGGVDAYASLDESVSRY